MSLAYLVGTISYSQLSYDLYGLFGFCLGGFSCSLNDLILWFNFLLYSLSELNFFFSLLDEGLASGTGTDSVLTCKFKGYLLKLSTDRLGLRNCSVDDLY